MSLDKQAPSSTHQVAALKKISRVALYTAIAATVGGLERLVPTPLPWIRLGLANGIALIVLYSMGFRAALTVNVLRTAVVALLFGTWASPGFALSLGGAIVAVWVMAGVALAGKGAVGPVGVSATGAFAHMLTQFALAAFLLVHHAGLFAFTGPSLIAAVVSGVLIGFLAEVAIRRLPENLRTEYEVEP